MGEYFLLKDSIKVTLVEVDIVRIVKDSVVLKLHCQAYYSNSNRLDSIICKDTTSNIVTKYNHTYLDNGDINKTSYYNNIDGTEVYRTQIFIIGKEASLEYSNNKNDKGYKLTTLYDECGIEMGKLWHTNDTLEIRQIIKNIYDKKYNCNQILSRSIKHTFNPYYSIYLSNTMTLSSFDFFRAGTYKEEYIGIRYVTLKGDTILITETDSINFIRQTKILSTDTLNYTELISKTLNGYGANTIVKWYDTKYSTIREDEFNHTELPGSEESKYYMSVTNQNGTFDYQRLENTPKEEMIKSVSNKKTYKYDFQDNWIKGIFEKEENEKIFVNRKINYD
ncbi:MAG: hypothetical protein WAT79_05215 [Saprospiraceae bacterium]